jgi:hypothetical protein
MIAITGVSAAVANQSAKHKVFVEGSDDNAIDPIVIETLLRASGLPQVEVRAMGACDNVRSTAQALVQEHPSYYFIIDRDDCPVETVEKYWANFPNPKTHNLLVWRKREIENYFLDPEYLTKSKYLRREPAFVEAEILKEANKRIFMDAANLVLMSMHSAVGRPFVKHFADPDKFKKIHDGLNNLLALKEIGKKIKAVSSELNSNTIEQRYNEFLEACSGNKFPLEYGCGNWINLMSGKELFRAISARCFRVKNAVGKDIHGSEQNNEIAKSLLQDSTINQPDDFIDLVALIKNRVENS